MKEKVSTIRDFASSKVFDLTNDIISLVREYLHEPSDYTIGEIRKKMSQLDFMENYTIDDDIIWNWAENYYGMEEDEDE